MTSSSLRCEGPSGTRPLLTDPPKHARARRRSPPLSCERCPDAADAAGRTMALSRRPSNDQHHRPPAQQCRARGLRSCARRPGGEGRAFCVWCVCCLLSQRCAQRQRARERRGRCCVCVCVSDAATDCFARAFALAHCAPFVLAHGAPVSLARLRSPGGSGWGWVSNEIPGAARVARVLGRASQGVPQDVAARARQLAREVR